MPTRKIQSQSVKPSQAFLLRTFLGSCILLLLLAAADFLCYQQALPVELDIQNTNTMLHVGSEVLSLGPIGQPVALQFVAHDPVIHEYQIDGTDSTNNFTLDEAYLNSVASSPYYRFQAWMRNLDGTSRWSDLRIYSNDRLLANTDWPGDGSSFSLPSASTSSSTQTLRLYFALRRPETPMSFSVLTTNSGTIQVTLNRNDRKIEVSRQDGASSSIIAKSFFPVDAIPFAAMVLDTIIRTLIATTLILLAVLLAEIVLTLLLPNVILLLRSPLQDHEQEQGYFLERETPTTLQIQEFVEKDQEDAKTGKELVIYNNTADTPVTKAGEALLSTRRRGRSTLLQAIHPLGLLALVGSLCFVAWIAKVQYNAEPHIFDAGAYLFAAKMYASGHLSVPIPLASDRFPGPFMVQFAGQWFGQYPPGTSLALVPGLWLGVPWLVEPILGTLALLAIGLIAARLFNRRVATLAVLLGTLSPFYSYLAASYLSHAVALCFLAWGFWALLRFVQGEASWNLPLATLFFGIASQTRDQVALLFAAIIFIGILLLHWHSVHANWRRWIAPGLYSLAIVTIFLIINASFNMALTHDSRITPRLLFFANDHWGFGMGVGFYGQHTLAAGFVNLDELLTILSIDLYGWPFYFTLAFIALPFVTFRATAIDWFLLICEIILTGAYVGYFYHGIYLGPRYLFETLPFLLILTTRGIFVLAGMGKDAVQVVHTWQYSKKHEVSTTSSVAANGRISIPTAMLVIFLLLFNLMYFLPRQIELHQDFSGMPSNYHIDLNKVYHPSPPLHNAIVVTNDYFTYQVIYFPLNDPYLHGDVLYALAATPTDYDELRAAYPGRRLYRIDIAPDGSVQYTPLDVQNS